MTYEEALALIKEEFDTRKDSDHSTVIRTGLTYDGCNGFCVVIYNNNGEVIITDMGETKEIFDEVTEEEWIALCKENGFKFRHWRIVRPFTKIEDLYEYIQFIDMISDMHFHLED